MPRRLPLILHHYWSLLIVLYLIESVLPQDTSPQPVIEPVTEQSNDHGRVINGQTVPGGKYPFVVSLQKGGYHFCGGSIVNDDTILTAAHCVNNKKASDIKVYIGHTSIQTIDQDYLFQAANVEHNSDFVLEKLRDGSDVGVIKLEKPIDFDKFSEVDKVCLPAPHIEPDGDNCVVVGWGLNEDNKAPKDLKEAVVPMLKPSVCQEKWGKYNEEQIICASSDDFLDGGSCQGDSGGPFVCPVKSDPDKFLQFGVVSFGSKGCKSGPSFFTRVSQFIHWISPRAEKDEVDDSDEHKGEGYK